MALMIESISSEELLITMTGGSRRNFSFWPKRSWVLILWTGFPIMKILSYHVLTVCSGARVQRRSMLFLFRGREKIIGSFHPFFSSPKSSIILLLLGVVAPLLFPLDLLPLFGRWFLQMKVCLPLFLIFSRSPWVLIISFWVTIKVPFLAHLISVQEFCFWGFLVRALFCPPFLPYEVQMDAVWLAQRTL